MKDNNLKLMDADEACKDLGITPHSLRFTSTVSLNIVGKSLNLLIPNDTTQIRLQRQQALDIKLNVQKLCQGFDIR